MSDSNWRSLAIMLAVVLALGLGLAFAVSMPSSPSAATNSPGGSSAALGSGQPGGSAASIAPGSSAGSSGQPAGSAGSIPSASPLASPSPTATPVRGAPSSQIVLAGFRLDASSDSAGAARTFTFKTDGPGTATAKLATSTKGKTTMCLTVGKTAPLCRNWTAGTLTGITSSAKQTTFVVTLIGQGAATPTVDLTLKWPANTHAVTLTNGRFDGTDPTFAGYNGISARISARIAGTLAVKADWGGHPFNYTYALVDLTNPAAGGTFNGNGTGIGRSDPLAVKDSYGFSLTNADLGFGATPMTLTVTWP